ncbi:MULTISPECIES: ABC transporter permease subunit [unclassified Brevundimonas]|uniref:ABC transporter permease subunit n=1 Tax=unclassified Brevundimonas TaxID=2622653 RepID=UPI0025B9F050|nr:MULTISPECIES: ABC transporter permease subunit [unclassified Brevundimonas]
MLLDAVRAELFRFSRNTTAWLWGLLVIPLGSALTGIFARQFLQTSLSKATQDLPANLGLVKSPLNIGDVITDQTAQLAGANLLAFFLFAAAVIAASDYRWESWRLIRPRNSRRNLILGKAIAIAIIALIPLGLFLLCETIGRIISASLENRPLAIGFDFQQALATVAMFVVSWLRTIQIAGLAVLAGVMTRSVFGGYVLPLALSVGTFMVAGMLFAFGWTDDQWRTLLLFPAKAYGALQTALAGGPVTAATTVKAIIGLGLWLALPPALAVWVFERQDLSKE